MDKRTLQEKLNQPYYTENWKEIVQYVFPNVQLFGAPRKITVINEKVESFSQLGNVRLNDGKNLALFELTLKPHVNILRNRVELNNLVSQFIDQEQTHGVLSVFEQGQDDYRFTFSAKATEFNEEDGDFAVKRTDTKRYTYVLGRNESCRTPAERLFSLAEKKEEADIKAIQDAFSVEKLSKEFFNGYKEHYLHFVQHITGKCPQKVNNKWEDQVVHAPSPMLQYIFNGNEKNVRDFVKLMLGRLVFIHFVQKKRWLGVPAEQEGWKNGDPNFLFNAFQQFEHKDLFYSHFLEPLFNEALNQDNRPGDVFAVTGTKVPYLNGGLFEKGELDVSSVNFPAGLFEGLLEFFNRFNFTIDESDLSEREVGIDPEMLGHIFENLLEDNKDKGAFYTPKEIVHYMCQESLKEYLKTKLEEESLWPKDEVEANSLEQALGAFIKRKEAGQIIDFDKALATALRDVKICDPAIGSGAFPMGLLNEIYHCMFTLYHASPDVVGDVWGMNSWEPDTVKKNIIQNSIYGVDIEKGAVDIARLRFWLSLLIEEEKPNPLPNLDYKIVVGNSLLSKLGDEVIDIDWSLNETTHGFFGNEFELRKIEILKKISREQREFFNPDSDKKKLADDIRKLKIDLLINQLELMVTTKGVETLQSGGQANIRSEKSRVVQTEIYLKTLGWKNSITQLKKLKGKFDQPLQFFDWKLDFPEVLNESINPKPGFDIVIGNPPYVNVEKIDKSLKNNISKFNTAFQKYDLYVLFYEIGINLIKRNRLLCFITSNKFLSQGYGLKLRQVFLSYRINQIVNFNYDVFETATVRTCILQISKKTSNPNHNIEVIDINSIRDRENFLKRVTVHIPQRIFEETEENNFRINLTRLKIKILEKIKKNSLKVEDIFSVNYGLRPSSEKLTLKKDAFIHEKNHTNFYKKYFEGKDMGYWRIKSNSFLDYRPDVMYNAMFSELFENPKLVGLRTLSDIGKLRFIFDEENFYCNDSVVILMHWYLLEKVNNQTIQRNINQNRIYNSRKFNYFYVQGILNSNLIKFFVNELLYDGTHFYPNHMKALPIKEITLTKQNSLIKHVEYIHETLKTNSKGEIHIVEQQIDNLVYRLYDLTYDEVKVIDPDFSLSKEEYENITLEG